MCLSAVLQPNFCLRSTHCVIVMVCCLEVTGSMIPRPPSHTMHILPWHLSESNAKYPGHTVHSHPMHDALAGTLKRAPPHCKCALYAWRLSMHWMRMALPGVCAPGWLQGDIEDSGATLLNIHMHKVCCHIIFSQGRAYNLAASSCFTENNGNDDRCLYSV